MVNPEQLSGVTAFCKHMTYSWFIDRRKCVRSVSVQEQRCCYLSAFRCSAPLTHCPFCLINPPKNCASILSLSLHTGELRDMIASSETEIPARAPC